MSVIKSEAYTLLYYKLVSTLSLDLDTAPIIASIVNLKTTRSQELTKNMENPIQKITKYIFTVVRCLMLFLWDIIKYLIINQVLMRPMFGAFGKAGSVNSIAFVSKVSMVSL